MHQGSSATATFCAWRLGCMVLCCSMGVCPAPGDHAATRSSSLPVVEGVTDGGSVGMVGAVSGVSADVASGDPAQASMPVTNAREQALRLYSLALPSLANAHKLTATCLDRMVTRLLHAHRVTQNPAASPRTQRRHPGHVHGWLYGKAVGSRQLAGCVISRSAGGSSRRQHEGPGRTLAGGQQEGPGTSSLGRGQPGPPLPGWSPWLLQCQALVMFLASACLGPFLDGMHSSNNVLHYHDPFTIRLGDWQLESCWWVPVLFGVAGIIIGVGVPVLDTWLAAPPTHTGSTTTTGQASAQGQLPHTSTLDTTLDASVSTTPQPSWSKAQVPTLHTLGTLDTGVTPPEPSWHRALVPEPSWSQVLACIALFVTQYGLSGRLEAPLLGTQGALDAVLIAYAAVHFAVFDRTAAGLVLSVATMVGGPLIEVFLINVPQLYHYEHPHLWGIPTWIAFVYFCGGPAVGNLGRKVAATLRAQEHDALRGA